MIEPNFHRYREAAAGRRLPVEVQPGYDAEPAPAPTPASLVVDGIRLDPLARLDALDRIARQHGALLAGLNDRAHDLRDRRRDLDRTINAARGRDDGRRPHAEAEAGLAAVEAERAAIAAQLADVEAELAEAAEASAAARAVLKRAVQFAGEHGLPTPASLSVGGR